MAGATLTLDNPVFRMFLGYAALVILKTLLMSVITAYHRLTKNIFVNEEDAKMSKVKVTFNNPDVERVRRCHLNDLENVLPFVLLGFLYVATGPSLWAASLHFRIFTASRFIHTFAYLFSIPQPTRGLAFLVGHVCNFSLVYNVICQAAF